MLVRAFGNVARLIGAVRACPKSPTDTPAFTSMGVNLLAGPFCEADIIRVCEIRDHKPVCAECRPMNPQSAEVAHARSPGSSSTVAHR